MNHELPDFEAGFRKVRGTRDQIANIRWIKKAREFQENALAIANTLFQQHKRRLHTWTSPDGQH